MEFNQLLDLIKTVSEAKLSGFTYEEEGLKISMEANKEVVSAPSVSYVTAPAAVLPADSGDGETGSAVRTDGNIISSPLVGTFYSAPSEDTENFVKIGDPVKKGQTLAIIEAMKLMNEIESDYDGIVKEILVDNAQAVEYGQPLFVIA